MKSRLQTLIVVAALALFHWHVSAVMAQELHFSHGAVEGGRVITNRSQIQINESSAHVQLPSSALTMVLQPGDSDLFVFEFDAECFMGGDPNDYLSVQARLNGAVGWAVVGGLGPSFLQPQDNPPDLAVCKSGTNPVRHTISKSWVIRLSNDTSSPVTYTFSIWVRAVNIGSDNNIIFCNLDNRIVRFTRYN
jgi:hypothetical protein